MFRQTFVRFLDRRLASRILRCTPGVGLPGASRDSALAAALQALQQIDGTRRSTGCIADASRMSSGTVVQCANQADADDAILLVALGRGLQGHKIQVIVSDGVDFDDQMSRLIAAAALLNLTVARVTSRQDEMQRRSAYQAAIVVCPVMQLLKDRARDLLCWPLRVSTTHRQFDRLYGRRSAASNRLLPVVACALVHQVDRVLVDQLALKVTADMEDRKGGNRPAGAVHALSLFLSYSWLGGSTAAGSAALRDIRRLYGVRVFYRSIDSTTAELVPDVDAQCKRLRVLVDEFSDRDVYIEVHREPLAVALRQALDGIHGTSEEWQGGAMVTSIGERVWIYRERSALERQISKLEGRTAVIITTSLDPAPGAVRRLQASADPNNRLRWLAVHALDEPMLAGYLSPWFISVLRKIWSPGLGRLLEPLVGRIANQEERRQRRTFVESLSVQRRRFAFAPHWGQRYE